MEPNLERIRRRRVPGSNDAGSLLIAKTAGASLDAAIAFSDYTGLGIEHLSVSPACSIALPVWPASDDRRPWPVKPEAMWHPLFWMDTDYASRLTIELEGGRTRPEQQWEADLRTCLLCELAAPYRTGAGQWRILLADYNNVPAAALAPGEEATTLDVWPQDEYGWRMARPADARDNRLVALYDPEDGTWLDIPYLFGIDLDSEEGAARMGAWLEGHDDRVLDRISVKSLVEADGRGEGWEARHAWRRLDTSAVDPDGALTRHADDWYGCGAALWGESIAADIEEAKNEIENMTQEQIGDILSDVARFADGYVYLLHRLPSMDRSTTVGKRLEYAASVLGRGDLDKTGLLDGLSTLAWVAGTVAKAFEGPAVRALLWEAAEGADAAAEAAAGR